MNLLTSIMTLALAQPTPTGAQPAAAGPTGGGQAAAAQSAASGGAHAFDFIHGRWHVSNRRLEGRLVGSTTWRSFDASSDCRPLAGGIGNMDVFSTDFWEGFVGMTLRFYDPATDRWSLYWVDNRTGVLQPPVVGSFSGPVGIFEGDDVLDGRQIRVRFTWSREDPARPTWEQAFSADGGITWETNWVMVMSAIED